MSGFYFGASYFGASYFRASCFGAGFLRQWPRRLGGRAGALCDALRKRECEQKHERGCEPEASIRLGETPSCILPGARGESDACVQHGTVRRAWTYCRTYAAFCAEQLSPWWGQGRPRGHTQDTADHVYMNVPQVKKNRQDVLVRHHLHRGLEEGSQDPSGGSKCKCAGGSHCRLGSSRDGTSKGAASVKGTSEPAERRAPY